MQFRTHKVIYRRYAGLFFSICVDITDNELVYLECIHLFVEILDHFFSNVCELDLVFNFHKVTWEHWNSYFKADYLTSLLTSLVVTLV
jgi:AP-2 complex subunit sigma-1